MCGICGIASRLPGEQPLDEQVVRRMTHTLQHRGPDSDGFLVDEDAMLGMRRLSIIDLATGEQPISNENGTIWVVFNGEIYNFQEIRKSLEQANHRFATKSDTEVIVHAYEEYGERCLEKFNGMFAIAIWDQNRKRLFLARDRVGIKPLYYWFDRQQLVFGSELKAVRAHPDAPGALNAAALDAFLSLEYIPGGQTIYQDIHKLPPGHYLTMQDGEIRIVQYWDLAAREVPADEAACIELLTELIDDSVRLRMISDVPLGAFLSGGIDSSTVLAFMNRHSNRPVKTFSIGFNDKTYNELAAAGEVAQHFNTDHHYQVLEPEIDSMVERLVRQFDEPFGDFSIFPTYLVSKLAREHVKVVLTGDGGDEIFAGYDTYVAQRLSRYTRWLPESLRRQGLPGAMNLVPPQRAKKGLINKTKRWVEGAALPKELQHVRWMIFLTDQQKDRLYTPQLKSRLGALDDPAGFRDTFRNGRALGELGQQQYVDIKTYLADDILTKVDRMSMAVSLEARVPLLDYRIVEFAVNLPAHLKLHRGRTKVILRKAMEKTLPPQVLRKPKQGFSSPVKNWLAGPLKPMMMDLLSESALKQQGLFEPATVQKWIGEHVAGSANHSHRLWALMVYEIWQRQPQPVG